MQSAERSLSGELRQIQSFYSQTHNSNNVGQSKVVAILAVKKTPAQDFSKFRTRVLKWVFVESEINK